MKPLFLIIGILIFGVLITGAASCETGTLEQYQYDGGREWLITKSIGSANGTANNQFWGPDQFPGSLWNKVLKDRVTVGGPDTKAQVILGVDEGEYELQFFDADGDLADSLTVQGGIEKTLEIELSIGALRNGYGASASDAKGIRYEIKLIFP